MNRLLHWKANVLLLMVLAVLLFSIYLPPVPAGLPAPKNEESRQKNIAVVVLKKQMATPLDPFLVKPSPVPLPPLPENTEVRAFPESRVPIVAGIFYDPRLPMAAIEGKIRREGDEIHGTKLIRIKPESVIFEVRGRRIEQPVSGKRK